MHIHKSISSLQESDDFTKLCGGQSHIAVNIQMLPNFMVKRLIGVDFDTKRWLFAKKVWTIIYASAGNRTRGSRLASGNLPLNHWCLLNAQENFIYKVNFTNIKLSLSLHRIQLIIKSTVSFMKFKRKHVPRALKRVLRWLWFMLDSITMSNYITAVKHNVWCQNSASIRNKKPKSLLSMFNTH